jgi:RimJ/RimL family protein N-acetyltransferase
MANKKNKSRARTQKKESRIAQARNWLPSYEGTKVVRAYRKKFHVDTICAVRELQEIGYEFPPGYVDKLLKSEAARIEQHKAKKEEKRLSQLFEEYNDWQDDRFFYIAGYTSGGAPYGVTWEEMGLEPYENEFDDEDIEYCHHYDLLNNQEKDLIDSRLRDDFSHYVSTYRRLPSKQKQQHLIKEAFESCLMWPLQYSKDFNSIYYKIIRKRKNAFIREGVLPKRFTPTEIKKLYKQSVMLESERLIFRKITETDFDSLAIMFRDPEVMAAWEHTFTDEQIQKWIDNQISRYQKEIVGYFAAIQKDTSEFIGQMGLLWNDFGELRIMEIGYMLNHQYWGMGYATEGAAALVQYAFTEIGLNKVYTSIRPNNQPSIRVAERIGMIAEGSFIKHYNDKDMEHIIYSKDRN